MPFWSQGVTESKCTPATFPARPPCQVAEGRLYSHSIVEDGQDGFLVACVAAADCLRTGLALSLLVPPEQYGSGLLSWPLPLDEAKLPRRMVQV